MKHIEGIAHGLNFIAQVRVHSFQAKRTVVYGYIKNDCYLLLLLCFYTVSEGSRGGLPLTWICACLSCLFYPSCPSCPSYLYCWTFRLRYYDLYPDRTNLFHHVAFSSWNHYCDHDCGCGYGDYGDGDDDGDDLAQAKEGHLLQSTHKYLASGQIFC